MKKNLGSTNFSFFWNKNSFFSNNSNGEVYMKKTTISFGLVNIPVEIYPAIKNNDIAFNQLHKKCLSRIRYIKYCPHCKKEVKQSDIIRGYEIKEDQYIPFSNEEFNKLKSEDEKMIEIIGFVTINEIDPIYYEKSYVLRTNMKSKSFSLFKEALNKTKRVAIAKTVIGTKFYYVVIRLKGDSLIMNTLYFDEEVIIPEEVAAVKFTKKELDLAIQLINTLKMKFKPEDFVDEYHEKIEKAIKLKEEGKALKKPKTNKSKNIKDLMTALELSLKNVS